MQGRGGRQPGAGAGAAEDQPGPAGPDQPPDGRAGATLAGVEVAKHVACGLAWPVNSTVEPADHGPGAAAEEVQVPDREGPQREGDGCPGGTPSFYHGKPCRACRGQQMASHEEEEDDEEGISRIRVGQVIKMLCDDLPYPTSRQGK